MTLLNQLLELEITWFATWALLHALWLGTIVWVLFRGFVFLTSERNSRARYQAGMLALTAACLLPLAASWVWHPQPDIVASPTVDMLTTANSEQVDAWQERAELSEVVQKNPVNQESAVDVPSHESTLVDETAIPTSQARTKPGKNRVSWMRVLTFVSPFLLVGWIVGVCAFALRPLIGWRHSWKLRRHELSDVEPELLDRFETERCDMGIRHATRIFYSGLATVPMVVGIVRPIVLLPLSITTSLSPSELSLVLRHELAHIRRQDTLLNIFQIAVETLLFFHPCVWAISRTIRMEREKCCDDFAARSISDRTVLAKALIHLEEHRGRPLTTLSMSSNSGELKDRVTRLLNLTTRQRTAPGRLISLTIVALLVIAAVSAVFQQQTVASDPEADPTDRWEVIRVTTENNSSIYAWKSLTTKTSKTAQKLANVFPEVDSGKKGKDSTKWKTDLTLELVKRNSTTGEIRKTRIRINFQQGRWSEGNGDWQFQPTWAYRYAMAALIRENRNWQVVQAEQEAAQNWKTYQTNRKLLANISRGKWVVIANGRLTSSFESFIKAVAYTDRAHSDAQHCFVFRPGIDDSESNAIKAENIKLHKQIQHGSDWIQIGEDFRVTHDIRVGNAHWTRGKRKSQTTEGRAFFQIGVKPNGKSERFPTYVEIGYQGGVVISHTVAASTGLYRCSVPLANHKVQSEGVHAVRCVLKNRELGIDEIVHATVFPLSSPGRKKQSERKEKYCKFLVQCNVTEDPQTVKQNPWVVYGRVVDDSGNPVAKAHVVAHFGYVDRMGARYRTLTDRNGRYVLRFNQRHASFNRDLKLEHLPVNIKVSQWKYVESSFGQLGKRVTSDRRLDERTLVSNEPTRIDFQLERTVALSGFLKSSSGELLQHRKIELSTTEQSVGGSQVLRYRKVVETDAYGRFVFHELPLRGTPMIRMPDDRAAPVKIPEIKKAGEYQIDIQRVEIRKTDAEKVTLQLSKLRKSAAGSIPEDSSTLILRGRTATGTENAGLKFGRRNDGLIAAVRVLNGNFSHVEHEKWFNQSRNIKFELVILNQSRETRTLFTTALRERDLLSLTDNDDKSAAVWSTQSPLAFKTGTPVFAKVVLKPGEQVSIPSAEFGIVDPERPAEHRQECGYKARLANGIYVGKVKFQLPNPEFKFSREQLKDLWQGELETGTFRFHIGKPRQMNPAVKDR